MFSRVFVTACMLAVAYANHIARSMRVHDKRTEAPSAFAAKGAAYPDTMLNLRIQLAQTDIAGLEDALMAVSTPGNALYGQHLTKEEVSAHRYRRDQTSRSNCGFRRSRASSRRSRRPSMP